MMSGSNPLSCSPLSFDDLIDDSYLGAPVGKTPTAGAAKEEASLLENRQASETVDRRH